MVVGLAVASFGGLSGDFGSSVFAPGVHKDALSLMVMRLVV